MTTLDKEAAVLAIPEICIDIIIPSYHTSLFTGHQGVVKTYKLPSKRSAIKKLETLAESFVLLDSLIFKMVTTPNKEAAVLAIPDICIDKIIALYHTSLFTGHQGVVKHILL